MYISEHYCIPHAARPSQNVLPLLERGVQCQAAGYIVPVWSYLEIAPFDQPLPLPPSIHDILTSTSLYL